MGLAQLSKKEQKSGYLKNAVKSSGGKLNPEAKMLLRLKHGHFQDCPNCGCPKARRRYPRPGKRSGLHCMNCGWVR